MSTKASWLECPVCEYRFSVPPEFADKTGKCPKCERIFHAADCHFEAKKTPTRISELQVPVPAVLDSIKGQPPVVVTPPVFNSSPPAGSSDQVTGESGLDVNQKFVTANKSTTNPNRILLYVALSCVLAIGLLIGIPWLSMSLFSKSDPVTPLGDVAAVEQSQSKSPIASGADEKKKTEKSEDRKAEKQPRSKPNQRPGPFSKIELDEIWKTVHPSIVLVIASSNDGEKNLSHGVVISDDGKIAVNCKRVEGAAKIDVRFAATTVDSSQRWQDPIPVAALISKDPGMNVAIIDIAQKTVPVTQRKDPVTTNEKGVIPVLNNKSSEEFLRMTTLRGARTYTSFTAADQNILKQGGFNPPATSLLQTHSAKVNKSGYGLPVFDRNGHLIGAHLDYLESAKTSIAIPLASLLEVANQSVEPAMVFTRAPQAKKSGSVAKAKGVPKQTSTNSGSFEESSAKVSGIEWKIADESGYALFQDFAIWLSKAKSEYLTADFTRRIELEKQFEECRKNRKDNLFWGNPEVITKVNTMALQALGKDENGWFAFVKIVQPAGLAPEVDDQPAILVEILLTGENALLIPGDVEGSFLPGKEFMVFGLNKQQRRLKTNRGVCSVIDIVEVDSKN